MEACTSGLDRRSALGAMGAGAALLAGAGVSRTALGAPVSMVGLGPDELGWDAAKGEFVLPPLPYKADALEPHIDAETMTIHHDKHHAGYVAGLNKALKALERIRDQQAEPWQIKYWSRELAFHSGGHMNHTLFWNVMGPPSNTSSQPGGALAEAIKTDLGSFEKFVGQFKEAAKQVEGSGWAWLVVHRLSKKLMVMQGEKQQDLTGWGVTPILGVDVWEHAYYLKYRSDRGAYVNAFMNVINWTKVGELYDAAKRA
ncbi:MAG: superoxide dismutase [Phycisphaerales bacterium]